MIYIFICYNIVYYSDIVCFFLNGKSLPLFIFSYRQFLKTILVNDNGVQEKMITEFTLYQSITIKLLFKKTLQLNYSRTKITKRAVCHIFLQCIKSEICCFILHSTHFKFQTYFLFFLPNYVFP